LSKDDKIVQASDAIAEEAQNSLANRETSLDKRGFFDKLGDVYEKDLFPKKWSKVEVEKASQELLHDRRLISGFWSQVPRICTSECLNRNDCRLSNKPVGYRCPEEIAFLELLMRKYVQDLNVSMDDMSSISMIRDLCDIEIQLLRKHGYLANEEMILDEPILDARGEPTDYVRRVENPIMGSQVKLLGLKSNILKSLVATRESRLKAASNMHKDDEMSRAVRALRELKKAIEKGEASDGAKKGYVDSFIDAEYEVVSAPEPKDDPEE
jgi:hypothetical protein